MAECLDPGLQRRAGAVADLLSGSRTLKVRWARTMARKWLSPDPFEAVPFPGIPNFIAYSRAQACRGLLANRRLRHEPLSLKVLAEFTEAVSNADAVVVTGYGGHH